MTMMSLAVLATLCIAFNASPSVGALVPNSTSPKRQEELKTKFDDLDKMAHAVSWHKEPLPAVPAKIKAKVEEAHAQRNATKPMVKVGSCFEHIPARQLGFKTTAKAVSLLNLAIGQRAPEHPGANSFAKPGAGNNQVVADNGRDAVGTVNGEEPFVSVLKDGYFEVGCYHDQMLEFGDKYGDDKDKYGSVASHAKVSIVKYKEVVLEMEHKAMTPRTCFQFCRTLPDMVFFGITNGDECYCEPYFKPQAGDAASCDAPCVGEQTMMCGNAKGKSTIWEMHLCANTAEKLEENTVAAEEALTFFHEQAGLAVELGKAMSEAGDALEEVGGLSGSPMSGDLGMLAKKQAGSLSKAFMKGRKAYEKLGEATKVAQGLEGSDFGVASNVAQADVAIDVIEATEGEVRTNAKEVYDFVVAAYPANPYEYDGQAQVAMAKKLATDYQAQDYRLASYAMGEKSLEPQGSSCSGDAVGMPMVGLGLNGCGVVCEQTLYPTKCVAFAHYQVDGSDDLCFMFSDVQDVETFEEPAGLLQKSNLRKDVKQADKSTKASAVCKVKMSEITTGFKPKGELKMNKRCFGACGSFSAREGVEEYSVPDAVEVQGKAVIEKIA